MSGPPELTGPDLTQGIPLAQIPEGELFAAHAFGKPLVVVRRGDSVRALGAQCTHYGGPLAEGLLVDDTVRCPWHHACFSLRTGEATRGPALNPVVARPSRALPPPSSSSAEAPRATRPPRC